MWMSRINSGWPLRQVLQKLAGGLTRTAASIDTGTRMALVAARIATPTITNITRLLALQQELFVNIGALEQCRRKHAPQQLRIFFNNCSRAALAVASCIRNERSAASTAPRHLRRANRERCRWSRRQWPRMMSGARSSLGMSSCSAASTGTCTDVAWPNHHWAMKPRFLSWLVMASTVQCPVLICIYVYGSRCTAGDSQSDSVSRSQCWPPLTTTRSCGSARMRSREQMICTVGSTMRSSTAKCGSSNSAELHSAPHSCGQKLNVTKPGFPGRLRPSWLGTMICKEHSLLVSLICS